MIRASAPSHNAPRAYRAYGLVVSSTLALPELAAASPLAAPDLTIIEDRLSMEAPEGIVQLRPGVWMGPRDLQFETPGVARYRVQNGAQITVERAAGADDESVRLFLLGTCFGAALMQRGLLVLHGNAIRIGDGCLVCVGDSGVGKSTLAAGFMRRGFELLADDVVAVDASCAVLPGIPRIKLWNASAQQLAIDTQPLARIQPGVEKFNVPIEASFAAAPCPLRWVYLLEPGDNFRIVRLTGMAKYPVLAANTYRPFLVAGMALRADHLEQCGRVASAVSLSKVTRPREGFDLGGLIDRLLADIGAHP